MNFPCLILDDFYDDPDEIRKFALEQDYFEADNGQYPGKRTKPLDIINPKLFNSFCSKFFSLYYDFKLQRVNWSVDSYFQLIDPYAEDKLNQGWTHVDYNSVVSGVIYLNIKADENSGTVICHLKEDELFDYEQKSKHEFNLGQMQNLNEYVSALEKNNLKFNETLVCKNRYNRIVSFDGNNFHRVQNYNTKHESRLTQVFFVNGLQVSNSPIGRLRTDDYE
jgi:hypothetical protein